MRDEWRQLLNSRDRIRRTMLMSNRRSMALWKIHTNSEYGGFSLDAMIERIFDLRVPNCVFLADGELFRIDY